MKKAEKLLIKLKDGQFKNWKFTELTLLLEFVGFSHSRTKGSHHIFRHEDGTKMNVQESKGTAKAYQLKQFAKWVEDQE